MSITTIFLLSFSTRTTPSSKCKHKQLQQQIYARLDHIKVNNFYLLSSIRTLLHITLHTKIIAKNIAFFKCNLGLLATNMIFLKNQVAIYMTTWSPSGWTLPCICFDVGKDCFLCIQKVDFLLPFALTLDILTMQNIFIVFLLNAYDGILTV